MGLGVGGKGFGQWPKQRGYEGKTSSLGAGGKKRRRGGKGIAVKKKPITATDG